MQRPWLITLAIILGLGAAIYFYRTRPMSNLPSGKITADVNLNTSPSQSPTPITGKPQVKFITTKGEFILELRPDLAPKTVTNFLTKWNSGYCNNLTFHRVEDWVVQGCDPLGNGTGGKSILPTETSSADFSIGAVGVARQAFPKEVSNDSQFFITKKPSSFLNGEYTYFGQVISGMDIINSLSVGDLIISTSLLTK